MLNRLAQLVERAGRFSQGSITLFTVIMEGDDQQDPVVDTVRSLLDGHIVVDREFAARNHYPPICLLDRLKPLDGFITIPNTCRGETSLDFCCQLTPAPKILVLIGTYQNGSDSTLDKAIATLPAVREFRAESERARTPRRKYP